MKNATAAMKDNFLTLFGLGRFRFAGSIASLIATILFGSLSLLFGSFSVIIHFFLFILLLIVTLRLLYQSRRIFASRRTEIVADEFLGMYLCLILAVPYSMADVLFVFLVYRAVDLLNIPPFTWVGTMVAPHWSVLADDLSIGFIVGAGYWFLSGFFS